MNPPPNPTGYPTIPIIDARLTIEPPPAFFISGTTCQDGRYVPFKFTATTLSQMSSGLEFSGRAFRALTPALFTRMSTRPKCSIAASTICSQLFEFVTSPEIGIYDGPKLKSGFFKSTPTTLAPSLMNFAEQAFPMPDPAPVTKATFPVSRPFSISVLAIVCSLLSR